MTYELAKQLKDAGYPQETEFYFAPKLTRFNGANDHNWDGESMTRMLGSYEGLLKVACPSLSELIEKCGEDFGELKKQTRDGWSCTPSRFIGFDNLRFQNHSNPKEAVAELWLVINNK